MKKVLRVVSDGRSFFFTMDDYFLPDKSKPYAQHAVDYAASLSRDCRQVYGDRIIALAVDDMESDSMFKETVQAYKDAVEAVEAYKIIDTLVCVFDFYSECFEVLDKVPNKVLDNV